MFAAVRSHTTRQAPLSGANYSITAGKRSAPAESRRIYMWAPRGNASCLAGVRPPWGRSGGESPVRGRAALTRGYRVVRPLWGRQPRRHPIAPPTRRGCLRRSAIPGAHTAARTTRKGRMPRRDYRPKRFRAAGKPPLLNHPGGERGDESRLYAADIQPRRHPCHLHRNAAPPKPAPTQKAPSSPRGDDGAFCVSAGRPGHAHRGRAG